MPVSIVMPDRLSAFIAWDLNGQNFAKNVSKCFLFSIKIKTSIKLRKDTIKVKINFTLEQVTKTHRGSSGIATLFF